MFDLLVFIGRFQPFHNEHKRVIDIALTKAEKVLVLVGSAGAARTVRNPFTYEERKDMIMGSFSLYSEDVVNKLQIRPLRDKTYNDTAWVKQVQDIVASTDAKKVGLIGASKDSSSYYLKMFPQWDSVNVNIEHEIHATEIRKSFFENKDALETQAALPKIVVDFMHTFSDTEVCENLRQEYLFAESYKASWVPAPYLPKHLTIDAVVEQSGHILLVKRRARPGKGMWALPGGHLNLEETLEEGVIRELREETKLKVPVPVLKGSTVATRVFDDPHRSSIGRVVTFASYMKLAGDTSLPKVKGSDDAAKAKWVPISEIREDQLFDDHYHIIQHFLGL